MLSIFANHRSLAVCLLLTHGVLAVVMFQQGALPAAEQFSGSVTVLLAAFVVIGMSIVNTIVHSEFVIANRNYVVYRTSAQAHIQMLEDECARLGHQLMINRLQTMEITGFDSPPVQKMNRVIMLEVDDDRRTGRPDESVRADNRRISDAVAANVCET